MALIQKAFSDIITFSRSSNATRIGPTGLVEYAPHNLLLRSQDFTTTWASDANRGSITANSIAAPDGTVTASTLVAGSGNFGYRYQNLTIVNTTVYTASCFLKSKELSFAYLELPGGGITYFNLSTGVVSSAGSGATASITSVGNGWYRCTVAFTSNSTSGYVNIGAANASGSQAATSGSGIYLWGAQLSVGPYALDYTPTTTAAVYGPRFDYDGSGVTIVEPVSRNLVTYSEQFDNAAWTKNNCSITATAAPSGENTASLLVPSSNGNANLYNAVTASSATYTVSVYAKASGKSWVYVLTPAGSSSALAYFNVSTGVVGSTVGSVTASITPAGNGWYRCQITATTASSYCQFGVADADGSLTATVSGSNGAIFWGAQLEVGSTATAYMVSGATNGFRAVPVVSGSATPKGLLIEEQRTNLVTYSEDFSNAAWNKFNTTISSNAITSPDGTVTADKIIESATTSTHYAANTRVAVNGTVYTTSVYLKMAERRYAVLDMTDGLTGGVYVYVDLQTGVITQSVVAGGSWTNASATITNSGNGWYRVSVTGTLGANNTATPLISTSNSPTGGETPSYTGDGTSGIYAWGTQLEAGSFATSYLPTLAASVTRSADVASVNTLSPWYNATEGTLFAEYSFYGADPFFNNTPVMINDGTENNYIAIFGYSSAYGWVQASGAASAGLTVGGTTAINTTYKAAVAYKTDDFAFSLSGISPATDSSGSVPTVTSMLLGRRVASSAPLQGHLRRIAYYPRRLLAAELQSLTA